MKNILLITIIIPLIIFSQNYNGPESIEYNLMDNSYFISNSSSGEILKLENGNLSLFASNLPFGPHGLVMGPGWNSNQAWVDGILYACSGGKIYGYNMLGEQVLDYNLNGDFLNGITTNYLSDIDVFDLFITDFAAQKLYQYDIYNNTHSEICSFPKSPNGICYDHINNRLIVVFWGNNAPIYEVNILDGTYTNIINTGLGYLDGITMDDCGNFYVSAWSSNAIHKYNSDFSQTEIIYSGLNNPADIDCNVIDNIIAVPNSGNNTVDFISYSCDNSNIDEVDKNRNLLKTTDLIGREHPSKGLQVEIFDNGDVIKKYILK